MPWYFDKNKLTGALLLYDTLLPVSINLLEVLRTRFMSDPQDALHSLSFIAIAHCAQVVCQGHPSIVGCPGFCVDDQRLLPTLVMNYAGVFVHDRDGLCRCVCA